MSLLLFFKTYKANNMYEGYHFHEDNMIVLVAFLPTREFGEYQTHILNYMSMKTPLIVLSTLKANSSAKMEFQIFILIAVKLSQPSTRSDKYRE